MPTAWPAAATTVVAAAAATVAEAPCTSIEPTPGRLVEVVVTSVA
jgi:hypothetical protein